MFRCVCMYRVCVYNCVYVGVCIGVRVCRGMVCRYVCIAMCM